MPFVSITRLRLRSWRHVPGFLVQALRSALQARNAAGNLAVSMLREARRTYWTRTVWTDEQAMKTGMLASPHRQAMRSLARWCDEASVAHWTQESPEPPSWAEAHRRMQRDGRPSRVDHPTQAHLEHRIAAPRVRAGGTLRFK